MTDVLELAACIGVVLLIVAFVLFVVVPMGNRELASRLQKIVTNLEMIGAEFPNRAKLMNQLEEARVMKLKRLGFIYRERRFVWLRMDDDGDEIFKLFTPFPTDQAVAVSGMKRLGGFLAGLVMNIEPVQTGITRIDNTMYVGANPPELAYRLFDDGEVQQAVLDLKRVAPRFSLHSADKRLEMAPNRDQDNPSALSSGEWQTLLDAMCVIAERV